MRKKIFLIVTLIMCMCSSVMVAAEESHHPNGVIPNDFQVDVFRPNTGAGQTSEKLPAAFDARKKGWITPVKDQDQTQLCWAYAMASLAETSMIKQGLAKNPDYSENHLAYFVGKGKGIQSRLNTSGTDYTKYLVSNYKNAGGNNKNTTFALFNWIGLAQESKYPTNKFLTGGNYAQATDDAVHLIEAKWYSGKDITNIKKAIMTYGSVSTAYDHEDKYYNKKTAGYHNPESSTINHTIAIVGWDDNYPASNFINPPKDNGAWLVKNSWGDDWGDKGYMWLPYEEKSLINSSNCVFAGKFAKAGAYTYNYHYDGSATSGSMHLDSKKRVGNIFKCGGEKQKDELLKAVGIAFADPNVNYSIQIYRNLKNPSNPVSGTPMLAKPITGCTDAIGYYTIPLKKPLKLRKGQTFSVVVRVNSGKQRTHMFADQSFTIKGWIQFQDTNKAGQSFVEDPGEWYDLKKDGLTARIRAYTSPANSISPSSFVLNEKSAVMCPGDKCKLTFKVSPANTTVNKYKWTSSNPKVAVVSDKGVVTAKAIGRATITLSYDDVKAVCSVRVQRLTAAGGPELEILDKPLLGTVSKTILNLKDERDPAISSYYPLRARQYRARKKSITIKWDKVSGADAYVVFGNRCGNKYYFKKLTQTKKLSYTYKNLKKGRYYKFLVVAYKTLDGKKRVISVSKAVHIATLGGDVCNYKTIKVNPNKFTVKKGKSVRIKADAVPRFRKLAVNVHRGLRFESTNKMVAKVTYTGKVTGVRKGKCSIFVYAQNGKYKRVRVTVK